MQLRMKEDLVSLGAMDERTGQPIELERSEVAVLRSTNHWYRDPIYKQLLFSSDLEMLQDCLVDDPPLSQPQHHHNFPPTEGDGSAPTKNFFRVASDHSMFSASSPSKPRPALDHEASVRQVAMLVRGLKRDQTQRLSSATSAPSPVPTSEPTPVRITDRNVARYTQLSGTAAEAPSELMRSSLVEFKRTTLSEMGIFLPRQQTLQSAAWRQHLAASLPATATAMTSAHHTAESGATSDAL